MTDQGKPVARAMRRHIENNSKPAPPIIGKQPRLVEELAPVARRIMQNAELMERFRQVNGSGDEDAARKVVDEVREHAKSIDPTINYVEGARIALTIINLIDRSEQGQ